jgi:hypothetical protein
MLMVTLPEFSSDSEAEDTAVDAPITIPKDESKTLKERWKEWKDAEKAAKAEGLPRAEAKNFFVRSHH